MDVQKLMKDMETAYDLPFNTAKCVRSLCNIVTKFGTLDPETIHDIFMDNLEKIFKLYVNGGCKELHMHIYYAMRWGCLNKIRDGKLQKNSVDMISLSCEVNDKGETIADAVGNDKEIHENDVQDFISTLLSKFSEQEVSIFKGLSKGLSMELIGNDLGITKQRVSQIWTVTRNRIGKHKKEYDSLFA